MSRDLSQLRRLSIEPRASLEAEIAGRFLRGERAPLGRPSRISRPALAAVLILAATLLEADYTRDAWSRDPVATVDRCCQDLDGGGSADDGILVESVKGEEVHHLVVYEDQAHQGHWTPANIVRYERRGGPSFHAPRSSSGLRVHQVCCGNYDGGIDNDDGVIVLLSDSNDVLMAAVFTNESRAPGNAILR